ncbi:MAG: site-2 protease family protein [Nitrospirae bacterium]|nr:site-2 protease family protein [Nitrospirota bacterium]
MNENEIEIKEYRVEGEEIAEDKWQQQPAPKRHPYRIHIILFVLTVFTTLIAGALQQGAIPWEEPFSIVKGIPFSFTLISILLTHELAHYFASRRHSMTASLPYFIPGPPIPPLPIGTFGAVIKTNPPIPNKRALLDIGVSGPLAGFIVSVAAIVIGLNFSRVVPLEEVKGITIGLGDSLGFKLLSYLVIGTLSDKANIFLHPIAFAGWIGFFVTAMNLLPIGQLDGGHVVYAVLGRWHRIVSISMVGLLFILGYMSWPGWYLWGFLTTILGTRHPPVFHPNIELDKRRKIIAWITLIVFILTFTPEPFKIVEMP